MKLSEINIRDPFILLANGKYYMYGTRGSEAWGKSTGLDVYVSDDLDFWSEPHCVFAPPQNFWADRNFWAPEVHFFNGAYYMFVSFKSESRCRGTQILKASSPLGPFELHSDGSVTPKEWECLDGTLYVENGTPYIVFCREWLQVKDGEMYAMKLSDDLKESAGECVYLFKASDPSWSNKERETFITDGPFMYKTKDGNLLMLWSSVCNNEYCEAITYSKSGSVLGPWKHDRRLLFEKNGGHGMIFSDKNKELRFVLHQPNSTPDERPVLFDLCEKNGSVYLN